MIYVFKCFPLRSNIACKRCIMQCKECLIFVCTHFRWPSPCEAAPTPWWSKFRLHQCQLHWCESSVLPLSRNNSSVCFYLILFESVQYLDQLSHSLSPCFGLSYLRHYFQTQLWTHSCLVPPEKDLSLVFRWFAA